MARLFFKDIPEGPTCSSCGYPNPTKYDDDKNVYFCNEDCFVDWFVNEEAESLAREIAFDRLYEIED